MSFGKHRCVDNRWKAYRLDYSTLTRWSNGSKPLIWQLLLVSHLEESAKACLKTQKKRPVY